MKLSFYLGVIRKMMVNTLVIYRSRNVCYFNQYSLINFFRRYGEDRMAATACGPFVCAMVVSTLGEKKVTPMEVAAWSCDHGYYEHRHGSMHSLIPDYCTYMGLNCTDLGNSTEKMVARLEKTGGLAIVLCKKGRFSSGRHFIVAGKQGKWLKVYNSGNVLDCYRKFTENDIKEALAQDRIYIGPIWCISKEKNALK